MRVKSCDLIRMTNWWTDRRMNKMEKSWFVKKNVRSTFSRVIFIKTQKNTAGQCINDTTMHWSPAAVVAAASVGAGASAYTRICAEPLTVDQRRIDDTSSHARSSTKVRVPACYANFLGTEHFLPTTGPCLWIYHTTRMRWSHLGDCLFAEYQRIEKSFSYDIRSKLVDVTVQTSMSDEHIQLSF